MIKTYQQALDFLAAVPQTQAHKLKDAKSLDRSRAFFDLLGKPQDDFKSVHIAGTSGKGSTAYITSAMLTAAGKKVGLTLSPHVYDIRERIQINNELISETDFIKALNEVMPAFRKMEAGKYGRPTYFETLLAMSLVSFRSAKIDYAVIETGLGGRWDSTNTISRRDKLAIVNQIGLDHTHILGTTIKVIASQKAGIITGDYSIALKQSADAEAEFKKQAEASRSKLEFVSARDWDERLSLPLVGNHQKSNAALALRALNYLAERDGFKISLSDLQGGLDSLSLPGRFEIRRVEGKTVVLDGAHNAQKMASLARTLRERFPGQRCVFVLAVGNSRKGSGILKRLIPLAKKIIVTSFQVDNQDMPQLSHLPSKVAGQLDSLGFEDYELVPDAQKAFDRALQLANETVVVTGSFYLISELKDELSKILA